MNYHVLNDSVVLNYDSKTTIIKKGDGRFAKIVTAIKEGRLDDIPSLAEMEEVFKEYGLEVADGIATVDGQELPSELSNRIVSYVTQGLPKTALVAFWRNLRDNPSFRARKMLYKFLEHNGHPITEDGCFIAYRGCTKDYRDRHTGKFDNSPGTVCELSLIHI